jgi:hypothetical protein
MLDNPRCLDPGHEHVTRQPHRQLGLEHVDRKIDIEPVQPFGELVRQV